MLTCGFFNSVNGDRKYNAEQMNNPYHRIVSDGVFAQPSGESSNDFKVYGDGTMNVSVHSGEGIFHGKWAKNDAAIIIPLPVPDVTNARIDTVVFRVDYNTRTGSVELKVGTPAASPTAPQITRTEMVMEYRLANVLIRANSQGITDAEITDTRAGSECGFVTHLLQQADITATYAQWQEQFEQWFREVKETLATSTLIRSYTSQYITATQGETRIPINISQYNRNLDILQVFVNGLRLIPDVEYTVDSNAQITLTQDLDRNQPVAFVVYKSVDGSEAETVVQQVYELQNKLTATKITDDTGTVKLRCESGQSILERFIAGGRGFHTMYVATGAVDTPANAAFRCFGHLTTSSRGAEVGYIVAMQADGSVYSNYINGGTWRGWRAIYVNSPEPLWVGESFMNASATITPSKKLSECRNGWVLVWSDYDDDQKVKNNYNAVTFCVPKKNASGNNWGGSSFMCMLPVLVREDTTFEFTCKQIYISDDKITGFAANATGVNNRGVILSAVYEY